MALITSDLARIKCNLSFKKAIYTSYNFAPVKKPDEITCDTKWKQENKTPLKDGRKKVSLWALYFNRNAAVLLTHFILSILKLILKTQLYAYGNFIQIPISILLI